VDPRAVLNAVKRKIPSPRQESNSRTPIVQPVAQDDIELILKEQDVKEETGFNWLRMGSNERLV
jgi:hypothetical protein